MITLSEIIQLHDLSIKKYGGSHGVRDVGLLDSAIARPYQTFGGEYLYTSIYEKAAAIAESLIINHPFVDGNKRTGFLAMFTILRKENIMLKSGDAETYQFVIDISTGKIRFDDIVTWLKNNTTSL